MIHSLQHLSNWVTENLESIPGDLEHKVGDPGQDVSLSQGTTTHYGQFREVTEPTTHAFRLEEENRVQGEHKNSGEGENQTLNPGKHKAIVLTTKPQCPKGGLCQVAFACFFAIFC